MSTALRTTLVAAGTILMLLAAPAMAQMMSLGEQHRVARTLGDRGYSGISFNELDRQVIVLAHRDGSIHSFAYNNDNGGLVPVGKDGSFAGAAFIDRSDQH